MVLMTSAMVDLHLHSKASDGVWTPAEVVEQAHVNGLEMIALTDHDTTYGVSEAVSAGRKFDLNVVPGIEIDCEYVCSKGSVKDIELLGLNIDCGTIQPFVDSLNKNRFHKMQQYVCEFNKYVSSNTFTNENNSKEFRLLHPDQVTVDLVISWYNLHNKDQKGREYLNPAPFISKMTFVNYISEQYVVPEKRESLISGDRSSGNRFKKEYSNIFEGGAETKTSFYDAIEAVKHAGGIAVLAHPGLSKGYENGMIKEWKSPENDWFQPNELLTPYEFILDLKKHGLGGIELYNYRGTDKSHAADQDLINTYFSAMASRLGLETTLGSDCHGPKSGGPFIGAMAYEFMQRRVA
jgi:histidinol phosphatase-like PHP family hydrolase